MKRAGELLDQIALPGQGEKWSASSPAAETGASRSRALWPCSEGAACSMSRSPLSIKLRQHMRAELRSIQQQVGITFIYITHDQAKR